MQSIDSLLSFIRFATTACEGALDGGSRMEISFTVGGRFGEEESGLGVCGVKERSCNDIRVHGFVEIN